MSDIGTINTLAGAFAAGLVTSLHCVGMCGPIACSVAGLPGSEGERQTAAVLYHVGRMISYSTLGAIAGAVGYFPLHQAAAQPLLILPWALVLVFLLIGFGLEKKLPRPAFLKKAAARLRFRLSRMSLRKGGLVTGLLTPLLPCGPLYLILGVGLLSGSALRGAEFMLAFAFGTLPLLWVAQHSLHRVAAKFGPSGQVRLRQGLALSAALIMAWRIWPTLQGGVDAFTTCPLCP